MPEIVMPRLSDSMEEGTILSWLKQVGDEVAVGEELVEIETDKANMAYEADVAGTLTEILAQEGETLPIGAPIAVVGEGVKDGGAKPAAPGAAAGETSSREPAAGEPPSAPPSPTGPGAGEESGREPEAPSQGAGADGAPQGGERVKASPVARRLAREAGVDLASLSGSGPGGRIVRRDVEAAAGQRTQAAAAAPVPTPAPAPTPTPATPPPSPSAPADGESAKGSITIQEPTRLQQVVARRMAESKATAPHFYLEIEIDMSRAVAARSRLKASAPEGQIIPSFNDMVVKACALALREFPRANGAYRDARFELYSRINVGIAVAASEALVVPTLFDADRKGLAQIAAESRALAERVREGTITPPELSGGTFTVSNLGMFGIERFAAVINSPQAAILAVGAIVEKPVVRDGQILTAQMMGATLACDHRILYGADGARFLARVRELLEEPLALAL
ncbi:MAG: dihydrolipoamide acetyltransferase family protein [Solirubrobacterales bacterium]